MKTQQRHDIQSVNLIAEQLNALMQTICTHHKDFDSQQLDGLLVLAYDLAGSVYSWTDAEEKIVFAIEDAQRERK